MSENYISGTYDSEGKTLQIHIQGDFDYQQEQSFKELYEHVDQKIIKYIIDFSKTTNIDNTALEMLITFRDYIGSDGKNIHLNGIKHFVEKNKSLSTLQQLFIVI